MTADDRDPPRGDDLTQRMEALVAEARASGRLSELSSLLAGAFPASRDEGRSDEGEVDGRYGMVGASPGITAVFDLIERVAPSDVPVLIQGETGTGKELVARAIHDGSPRREAPLLAENCAAVPANLLESELFGHRKGAFTGAVADASGHFVAADGGTMFLDEIGDMPLEMQAKLLRAIEAGEIRPVGASKPVRVDVRVVAATHRDLARMVTERSFRQDLLYRLNVVTIPLPPLRERNGDVELLVRYFLAKCAADDGVAPREIGPEALELLSRYAWPGNVRQLENEIRRVTALGRGRIEAAELSTDVRGA